MDCKNTMSAPIFARRCNRIVLLVLVLTCTRTLPLRALETSEDVTHKESGVDWIWSPAHDKDKVPVGDCYFRKTFSMQNPEAGELRIAADNRFELFVNGERVGRGEDWRQMEVYDISTQLKTGLNTVAVHVTNVDAGSAGLVARVLVKEEGDTFQDYSTDATWRTSVRNYQSWTSPEFPDSQWVAAKSYGKLGATLPWGDEVVLAGKGSRFELPADFLIERIMRDEDVGSLIAMAFDWRGNILVSREGGNLLLLTDSDDNGIHDTISMYCDKIRNVQGILPLGTRVFAVGDGPQGAALYRMEDKNRDGVADEIRAIVPLKGSKGEHGTHAVRLGPDGMLYVMVGNHARSGIAPGPRSPYRNWYEGDLVRPRHEDPRGHAVGIPAPGGTIFRTDEDGSLVEFVAGGLRNAYDFAFDPAGEIFTYDADMEWDMGAPWYRPTRVNHVTAGAELGWRSGWAKWPEYYLDSLPATINVGAGSPTGVEFYNHHAFPAEYRGTMFGCDWATGKIYCFRLEPRGASYRGRAEVFIEGRPLNATDIAVGPDGALYFCTGGRGTDGGVYRVRWTGKQTIELGQGTERILRQPQLDADWSKAQTANLLRQLGEDWVQKLESVLQDDSREVAARLQALEVLVLFGPPRTDRQLIELSQSRETRIRSKAAQLMSQSQIAECRQRLVEMLGDQQALVRRVACESLTRQGVPAPAQLFVKLLGDKDRFVAFAARRALEQLPVDPWRDLVMSSKDTLIFSQGAVSLLALNTSDASLALEVLQRCEEKLADKNEKKTQLNLLRVMQLAMIHGKLAPGQVPNLGDKLLAAYPSQSSAINRELVRMLVFLQHPAAVGKFAAQLAAKMPHREKLHLAAYAPKLNEGWDRQTRAAFLGFFERARATEGGYSVSAYIESFAREFFERYSPAESIEVLAEGEKWPACSLSLVASLPETPDAKVLHELRQLDGRVQPLCSDDDRFRRLRVGIMAVLGRSGEEASLSYLRRIYKSDPQQRNPVAMTLSQHPDGENWAVLVDSLKTLEGEAARQVLTALRQVPQRSRKPEDYRQVILLGLRLQEDGGIDAVQLLDHWSGQNTSSKSGNLQEKLAIWQNIYARQFPGAPLAEMPVDSGKDKWTYEELLSYLEKHEASTESLERGEKAFAKAQCVNCHRMGEKGDTIGPDLTTIAKRFQQKEILESIVYPDHNISDQYASKLVEANGRTYVGLVVPRGQLGVTVLLNDGSKVQLSHADIDDIQPSRKSVMPAGLLNSLSLRQVAELFDYMEADHGARLAKKKSASNR